jgi:hypothetical protein
MLVPPKAVRPATRRLPWRDIALLPHGKTLDPQAVLEARAEGENHRIRCDRSGIHPRRNKNREIMRVREKCECLVDQPRNRNARFKSMRFHVRVVFGPPCRIRPQRAGAAEEKCASTPC